jgi:transcriptional regulator with XRE-family HTH domain
MNSNEDLLKTIGNNIRKLRNERKISQQELADITNIAKSTVQRIESGKLNPTIVMLNNISIAMDIKLNDLINI